MGELFNRWIGNCCLAAQKNTGPPPPAKIEATISKQSERLPLFVGKRTIEGKGIKLLWV